MKAKQGKTSAAVKALPARVSARQYAAALLGELPQFAEPLKAEGGRRKAAGSRQQAKELKPQILMPKPLKLTGVEKDWMAECRRRWPNLRVDAQPFTVRLPSGTKYTPDVGVFDGSSVFRLFEVKDDFIHDRKGSIRAFKEAAAQRPEWGWVFVQRRVGQWSLTAATKMEDDS